MKHSSDQAAIASFLFNQDFYVNNYSANALYFYDQIKNPSVLCSLVETSEGNFVSGCRAPFGGIECSNVEQVDAFIVYLKETCRGIGVKSITIRQAPVCYQPHVSGFIHEALIRQGFQLKYLDTNQHIVVDSSVSFTSLLDDQKRRLLKKLKSTGVRVEIQDHVDSDLWYDLYAQSRMVKNFPITISKEDYMSLSLQFSDTYQYAGVYLENTLLANAVFVKVNRDVLYYFLAAGNKEYDAVSPSVLILETMYELAQKHQFRMLDLGISTVDGLLNEGLHFFKKHIGALDSPKNTYEFIF